ncbi:uncharacterized protein, partial [Amphiura filiformis]|uniref:uncharacterized protein n=1 Tax=Amphiura filiformis TaxID=82378 RepID=UPI003B222E94
MQSRYAIDLSSQLCVLEERPDPARGGALRWSLPYKQRCHCQGVVAPRKPTQVCAVYEDGSGDMKLWFVDDPTPLTNRMHWNKETLDILLERQEYCESNECSSNPCEHGGICYDRIGEYFCACQDGFSGSRCEKDNCLHQLGMEDKRIDNGQITASSVWSSGHGPQNARLNHQESHGEVLVVGSWVAANTDVNPWIQVNMRAIMWVSGVMIQGRNSPTLFQWVTKFKVAYNMYGSEWKQVKTSDNQEDLVFDGNSDRDTAVTKLFPSAVQATMIKIRPIEWHNYVSMRFDLIGCEDPEWQLVFKAVSGIASAPMNSDGFDEYDPYKVWQRNEPGIEEIPEARQLTTNFTGHYKSSFAVDWETRNIDKVMVVLLDYTGVELMTLQFNGTDSNSSNWFSKDRLLSSPYDDIDSEPQNYFSVEGDTFVERRWFINMNYYGCDNDAGWMVVAYDFTPDCAWERKNLLPAFLYSLKTTYINWNNNTDIQPLGLESGLVKDIQIIASSYHPDNRLAEFGRLNYNNYWAPPT